MQNNENETKEAVIQNDDINLEKEMAELTNVEQSSNTAVPPDNFRELKHASVFPEELLKSYYDPSVLTTNSPELQIVDKYFKGVTANDKDIENLLYEMAGSSFAETTKPNKSFILKGNRQKSAKARFLGLLKKYQVINVHMNIWKPYQAVKQEAKLPLNN